ncbi:hypothetical protein [Actinopolymorpha alba]|uniref:hypothetical protein n=1 Tax=Actinopolymorpha alba TaxID=533267 RepID=UPI00037DD4BC|nr:hypothetical protein [Actinopolymorpha alba]
MGERIYVEVEINTDLDQVWQATQDPSAHQQWDARFGEITYLPKDPEDAAAPQRFRYATRALPGLTIDGVGISAGERQRPDGTRTSALRFASDHSLSLIRSGAGYWRYVPVHGGGVRFLTGYDYEPGWDRLGPYADKVFRPLFGWLTAWSFDRLRLWLERGITPRRARRTALADAGARVAAVFVAVLLTRDLPAALTLGAAAALAVAGVLLPPSPVTPAARRCRRRPSEGRGAVAPATLARLERP